MDENTESCETCEGTGLDKTKMRLVKLQKKESGTFYCNCWCGWLLEQRNRAKIAINNRPIKEDRSSEIVLVANEQYSKVLVTTRVESENRLLLCPTIQTSKSNLEQTYEGERPPYAELLDRERRKRVGWIGFWQNRRLVHYAILEIEEADICILPNARWFSAKEIFQATVRKDVNEHLRQAIWLLSCMNSELITT